MLYAFPILIALMLGYMYWHAGYSMRRERIRIERAARQAASTADPAAPTEG